MSKSSTKWGFTNVSGVEFFLEPTLIPPLCPIETPDTDCPHRTVGIPKKLDFKSDRVYLARKRPVIKNVEWNDDVFYYGSKSFKKVEDACARTWNYVPLVVHNLHSYDDCASIFRRAVAIANESKRPIVFVSEDVDWIVCPKYVEVLNGD